MFLLLFSLGKHFKKIFCLYQHIKQVCYGACQTPITNFDYEWHRGDQGVAVEWAHMCRQCGSNIHKLKPTRLLNCLNFRVDSSWAL